MEEKTTQVAEARATLSYARISSRKVKIVADLMRGKSVEEAQNIAKFAPKASSEILEKLLNSAIYDGTKSSSKWNKSRCY